MDRPVREMRATNDACSRSARCGQVRDGTVPVAACGGVRVGVVESVECGTAVDVELEGLVGAAVNHCDRGPIGGLGPEQRDLDPVGGSVERPRVLAFGRPPRMVRLAAPGVGSGPPVGGAWRVMLSGQRARVSTRRGYWPSGRCLDRAAQLEPAAECLNAVREPAHPCPAIRVSATCAVVADPQDEVLLSASSWRVAAVACLYFAMLVSPSAAT
jgi:hypothetical protein